MLSLPQSLCTSAGGWTGVQESPRPEPQQPLCPQQTPSGQRGLMEELEPLKSGIKGMVEEWQPECCLSPSSKGHLMPEGGRWWHLNTGTVDLGQRPEEFYCVTYNKTRQSSCIKYTGVAQPSPSTSLPRVCLLCMWTPVVWSVCEGFILLSMSSGLIHLSITVHLNCMWLLLLGTYSWVQVGWLDHTGFFEEPTHTAFKAAVSYLPFPCHAHLVPVTPLPHQHFWCWEPHA